MGPSGQCRRLEVKMAPLHASVHLGQKYVRHIEYDGCTTFNLSPKDTMIVLPWEILDDAPYGYA